MSVLNSYVASLPRIAAERSLLLASAVSVGFGGGPSAQEAVQGWQDTLAGADEGQDERREGMEAFAHLAQMNERARASGDLWEQRVARVEAEV